MAVNGLRPLGDAVRSDALIGQEAAVELALAAFEQDGRETRGEPTMETVWWPSAGRIDKIHMVTIPSGIPLGEVTYLVGGPHGEVLFPLVHTSMAKGYAYPSSPLHNPTYEEVDLLHMTSTTNLTGDHVMVKNCSGSSSYNCGVQLAQPDANGDYFIEPSGPNDPMLDTDSFVEVQAYYAINTMHDFVADAGLDASFVQVAVNWTYPSSPGVPNAVFSDGNPPTILIGQINTVIDLALENDVIMHEYGHHVFAISSSTGWFEMDEYGPTFIAAAINEATADYYSCSCLGDPEIGEYWASIQPAYFPDGYMRTVDNEYTCPENLWGEAHEDGIVWSGFLWKVRQLIGAQADTLYLDVMAHFPSTTNFPVATQVYLERAALVLDASTVDQIRTIAETRGLDDCERFIELSTEGHECFIPGRSMLPSQIKDMIPLLPGELHYFIDVPADAVTLELREASAFADVVLLVRADQPVQHTFDWMTGLVSSYDFQVDTGGGTYDLLNPDPATPFEPGHTYYIHPTNRGDRQAVSTMRGWTETVAQDGGTDGGSDGGTDGGADSGADTVGGEDGGLPECPDGWDWTPDSCVPVCKSGYKPKLKDGQWTCVPGSSGCGHATGTAGLGLWLLAGLALLLRRRK